MEEILLQTNEEARVSAQASVTLSFKPFLEYLKKRLQSERSVKTEYYRHIIERFTENPAWKTGLPADDLDVYKELFEIVYFVLTPLAADDKETMWGLSTPVPSALFYSTEGLSGFFADNNTTKEPAERASENCKVSKDMQFMYGLVLERFYNISSLAKSDTVYSYTDSVTKLSRYYKVHVDTQFVNIHVSGSLPELDYDVLATYLHDGTGSEALICRLKKMLPLESFSFEGFTVITLTDVTTQHSLDKIREVMVHHSYSSDQYLEIAQALRTIAGNEHIDFRLVPIIGVNGKSTFASNEECIQSILMNALQESGITDEALTLFIQKYERNPRILVYNSISSEDRTDDNFLRILKKAPVESYALLPVYYHSELAGVLEIYSAKEILFDERLFSKVQTAIPLIAQLLKFTRDEFQAQLSNIIRDKFTSLQPAVQWRFNEVAWQYLQRNFTDLSKPEIQEIRFENVYPLYGAIDVRNSTSERNRAIHEDIKSQLTLLQGTLSALKSIDESQTKSGGTMDEACARWKEQIDGYFTSRDEIALNNFLETEVHPYLLEVRESHPEARTIVSRYLDAIDEREGAAFKNRSELETSLQLVNTKLNQYFDVAQKMLQAEYPFYFEKFRTDGIEYDLYIGQSIAPDKPFKAVHLKRLRQWQLQSMAEIARLTQRLLPQMPRHLHTTQLIFVHARAIDITFRNDERRFDVEGAYNIRYEVIKKRIDKVLIKDTRERLTQPGKIAIVYFNQQEAVEYISYIRELQQQGLLDDSLEYLELEELQGVNRLKALRVGVKYH